MTTPAEITTRLFTTHHGFNYAWYLCCGKTYTNQGIAQKHLRAVHLYTPEEASTQIAALTKELWAANGGKKGYRLEKKGE